MIDIPCVILSGGASKRMGEDKSLLPFKNSPTLIEYQHNKLLKIFSTVYISSKTDKFDFDANIIYDTLQETFSPMIALQSILTQSKVNKIFIVTVDVPFIEKNTFILLAKQSVKYDVTIAKDDSFSHNLCGVYSKSLLPIINTLLNDNIHKIDTLLKDSTSSLKIPFKNPKQFININTIEEYIKSK